MKMIRHLRNGFLAVALFPLAALAQLEYNYTDFVHGFNDNASRFTTPNTAGLLSRQVNLITPQFPDPDGIQAIDVQADTLFYRYLVGQPSGGHVLVGHSMGGLTSRSSYFRHPQPGIFAAIISVATPHQGAPIADNALIVAGYVADQVTDFFQTLINITNRPTPGNILSQFAVNLIQALARDVLSNNLMAFMSQELGLKSAGLNDIKTTSPTVARLNSTFDALPHANVMGTIGRRNAVFRVVASSLYQDGSYDTWIHNKNRVKSIVKACRQIGWNMIIRTNVGRVCNQVDNAIGSIDDRWAFFTMGSAEKRNPNATFDGLVPTSHSRYPGTTLTDPNINFTAPTVNHMNIQYNQGGIDQIAGAMLKIGMNLPPPPPPPPPSPSVSINGPTQIRPGATCTWQAIVTGGSSPYSYQWTNDWMQAGNGYEYTGSKLPDNMGSSFSVSVSVTDAAGGSGNGEITVFENPSAPVCFQ